MGHAPKVRAPPLWRLLKAAFIAWDQQKPFTDDDGSVAKADSDNPRHMQWLYEKALARAQEHDISGVTYKETLGVFKNIIPAIASTNALTSAVACNEVLKLRTACANPLDNYVLFNGEDGVAAMRQHLDRSSSCSVCQSVTHVVHVQPSSTLAELVDQITADQRL